MKKLLFLFLCVFALSAEAQYVGKIEEVISLPSNPVPTLKYIYQGNVYIFADGAWRIVGSQSTDAYAVSSFGGGGSIDSTIYAKLWRLDLYVPLTDFRLTDARTPLAHIHTEGQVANLTNDLASKEPSITAGTTAQYWRGDKTWQTLPSGSSPVYTVLANGTTAMAFGTNTTVKVTPTATATYTTTVPPAGYEARLIILTSGTTSRTITFGTGFRSTGTLATGTVTAKVFVLNFISDGTVLIESTPRTVAH